MVTSPKVCFYVKLFLYDINFLIRVSDGFDALDTLPDWYQYLLFLSVSASFGIRGAGKLMKMRAK